MKTSADGRAIVEAFEGCLEAIPGRPGWFRPYHDVVGVLTVGYGCTNLSGNHAPIAPGNVYSQADCDALLSGDLAGFEARVTKIIGVPLKQHEFDALVSFDFNTGGLDRSSIPAKIRDGRRAEVAPTLDRWNKAGGQVYRGLVRRRKAEGEEFNGLITQALATAGVHHNSNDPMPQKVERPTVPADVVTKATKNERRAAGGGAIAGGAGTVGKTQEGSAPAQPSDQGLPWAPYVTGAAMALGLIVIVVAAVLAYRKYRHLDADWA